MLYLYGFSYRFTLSSKALAICKWAPDAISSIYKVRSNQVWERKKDLELSSQKIRQNDLKVKENIYKCPIFQTFIQFIWYKMYTKIITIRKSSLK